MTEPTGEGERLIKEWLRSADLVQQCKSGLNRAECDARNAESALAKWMIPDDAKPGEKIAIWFGDSLIQVEVRDVGRDPVVTIRKRGKATFERCVM